jgi:rare lipoprotein A
LDEGLSRFLPEAAPVPAGIIRNIGRLSAMVLAGAWLAGCAQSSVSTRNAAAPAASRQASLPQDRVASRPAHRRVASTRRQPPFASRKIAAATPGAAHGIASYYWQGTKTANGEKFDTTQLTAAHPTLPFGTRLRVTNVGNGQSVTVRVNDRGPYVPGRIVDVSVSAAGALGMIDGGLAKVKLDVVQ